MNELKPCPFCGGEAKLTQKRIKGDNKILNRIHGIYAFVMCEHCRASTMVFNNVEVAIEAWNRRVDNGN